MGIVNASSDSFNPKGRAKDAKDALSQALAKRDAGAHILDLGGLSTRPGSSPCSEEEEIARLLPLVLGLRAKANGTFLSIDTWRAHVACTMLEKGASVINDVSGALWDPELPDVLASFRPGYVLMHAKGTPKTMQDNPVSSDIVCEVCHFFEERLQYLTKHGLPEDHIILDVGIGFGKTLSHNLSLLRHMDQFTQFGRPLLLGVSMKSLFYDLFHLPVEERNTVTNVTTALLYEKGVFWHRVHAVAETRNALLMAQTLAGKTDILQ